MLQKFQKNFKMFRRVRNRIRNIIENTPARVHAMLTRRAIEPDVINFLYENCHLKKLLKLHYNCDIELVSEEVTLSPSHQDVPQIYHIKLELKVLENPDEIAPVTNIRLKAKILGHGQNEKRERKKVHFCFEREIIMYNKVIPTMKDLQRVWNPLLQFQYNDLFPKFYGASLSFLNQHARKPDHSAAILLQNLRDTGYFSFSTLCDFEISKVIVKRLAQLHAIPITMQIQKQAPFVKKVLSKVNKYQDILDPNLEYHKITTAISTEPSLLRYKANILRHLQLYANNTHKYYITDSSSWHTICHSKCSTLNILFQSDYLFEPSSIKFVNLGEVELDSCCSDLLYFLLTSTTSAVLETYFDNILEIYFVELKRVMGSNLLQFEGHTFDGFMDEFESRGYVSIGRILFEIGRLYYAGGKDDKFATGTDYETKIIAVLKCMMHNARTRPHVMLTTYVRN